MIALVPTFSVEVVKLTDPPLSAFVPSTVVPFINETVSPFGGAPLLELTFAVNTTACPYVDGFGDDESVVVVATSTIWFTAGDVLPLYSESPS